MIYLMYGSDDYRAQAEAEAAARAALPEGDLGAITRLDGASVTWEAVRSACANQSLFSMVQAVLVRGLLGRWAARSDDGAGANRPAAPAFAAFAGTMAETTHLILLEGELRVDNKYVKALTALGPELARVKNYARLKDAALVEWIVREARSRGGRIDGDAAELLAARLPESAAQVSQALDKLLCYTLPDGRIARDHVAKLVAEPEGTNVFALIDAIAAKKAARVAELTTALLHAGQAPEQLLALLASRVRDLLLVTTGQAEGVTAAEVAAVAGWSDGKRYQITRSRADFTLAELLDAHRLLLAADHALKSRPAHERELVMFVTFLTIAQRTESAALAEALPLGI
jgi:DNA polymerase III delta subunit